MGKSFTFGFNKLMSLRLFEKCWEVEGKIGKFICMWFWLSWDVFRRKIFWNEIFWGRYFMFQWKSKILEPPNTVGTSHGFLNRINGNLNSQSENSFCDFSEFSH